jgi:hypothetical protein
MKRHAVLVLAVVPLLAVTARGQSVTSKDAPSPAAEVERLWKAAKLQAADFDRLDPKQRSEALRMLVTVQRGEKLASGVGWYDPSRWRYDWAWLAGRFDANRDGQVTRAELAVEPDLYPRLDRDRSGVVTRDDLDWSEQSAWVRRDEQALIVFRTIDRDGDGRATEAELQAYFKRLAGEKGYLNTEDLRGALGVERGGGKKANQELWLRCLIEGDLGSPFPGPRVDELAPDFTLATEDGKKTVTLSDYRGKKPVVLIFGSFT